MVVWLGETSCEPPEADTEPTPLSIENELALLVDHDNFELSPLVMLLGAAESEHVGAGGGVTCVPQLALCDCEPEVTVTVADCEPGVV